MKRLKFRRRNKDTFRKVKTFCQKNGQLFFMILLVLIGVLLGVGMYSALSESDRTHIFAVVSFKTEPVDFSSACVAAVSAAFCVCVLLIFLFFLGLTAYGSPLILLIVIFFGFWHGVAECIVYDTNGIYTMVLTVIPYMLISSGAILIAATQSMKMSVLFSRQLLPMSANCGGMWQNFKWYLLRYFFCFFLAFSAGVIRVVSQLL